MATRSAHSVQRSSDGSWVTLRPASSQDGRLLCRLDEDPDLTAVLRTQASDAYGAHVAALVASPPPPAPDHVRWTWPVDLLHDARGRYVGYLVEREPAVRTTSLAAFVDPERRAKVAPTATGRHLLLVARNVAVAVAGLHHAGHGRVRGRHMLLDEQTRLIVVRIDEFETPISPERQYDDQWRLGQLLLRLLDGQEWTGQTVALATAIRRVARGDVLSADKWFYALREAERSMPGGSIVDRPLVPRR